MATKPTRVHKAIVYKRALFHLESGGTLKALLEEALRRRAKVGERRWDVSDNSSPIFHAMGTQIVEPGGFVFGALMTYTPGMDPLFLVDDDQAFDIVLEKFEGRVGQDGKRREVLESMMYFGVVQNHLVLMQSQALKAPQLEAYLRWLLIGSGVLSADNTLRLVDTPSQTLIDRMQKGKGVRAIKLGGEMMPTAMVATSLATQPSAQAPGALPPSTGLPVLPPLPYPPETVVKLVTVNTSNETSGLIAALKSLMGPSEAGKIDFDKLSLSNIEMSVTLKYKRKTTEGGQQLMDSLGVALRNVDHMETELQLADGGMINGSDLKVKGKINVSSYDGQLSASEVYEGMRQWLLTKIQSEITPVG